MSLQSERRMAISALLIAGFGWGTTGFFVRALGYQGLSVYELLLVRLVVAGAFIAPLFLMSLARTLRTNARQIEWKPALKVGLAMVSYYLGAITAFHNLQLVVAALIIGSSPVIAWFLPFLIERRRPTSSEWKKGSGVALAVFGLLILVLELSNPNPDIVHHTLPWLGITGAAVAALITVFNARFLKRLGANAPKPVEVTLATVFFGLLLIPFFLTDIQGDIERITTIANDHLFLTLGFGTLATAIPGLAITYASTRLEPQATATVSIQLQVWSGVVAWTLLGESMSLLQIIAAAFVIMGSWICLRPK